MLQWHDDPPRDMKAGFAKRSFSVRYNDAFATMMDRNGERET